MKLFVLITFVVIAFNACLVAQTQIELNEIIIESSEEKRAADEEKNSIQDIKYLSRKDINHVGSKGVGEILKRLPGIVVSGPPMAYRNVKINGLDKEFQTIFIDGHRPAGGEDRREFKLDRLPAGLIESVEIIYNPGVQYGGTSPSGFINLKTVDVPEKRQIGLNLGLDHSNTISGFYPEGSFYYADKKGRFAYLIYAGRSHCQRSDESFLEDFSNEISGRNIKKSDVSLNTATTSLSYKINSHQQLKLKLMWSDQNQSELNSMDVNRRSQGGLGYKQDTSQESTSRKLLMTQLKHELIIGSWKSESSVRYDWSGMNKEKDRIREKDPSWETSLELEDQYLHLANLRSDWERSTCVWGRAKHHIKSGLDASYNSRDFNRFAFARVSSHKFWDEIEDGSYLLNESITAFYLIDELEIGENNISPGLRIEGQNRSYSVTDSSGQESYWTFLPALHGKHSLHDQKIIYRWSISRQNALQPFLYMVPVLKVKHRKEIIEQGNPDLAPSRSWNYQASISASLGDKSKIKIRSFFTDIRDVVEMKYLGIDDRFHYRVFQPMNIDSAMVYGGTFEYLADFSYFSKLNFRIWGNYSWNGSRVRDPGSQEMRRMNDQPVHMTSMNADYLMSKLKLRFSFGYTWMSKRQTFDTIDSTGASFPGFHYNPYGQLDCSVKYYITKWGYLSVSIHNLLNEKEVLNQGFVVEEIHPGRLLRFGLSLTM
jgi:outer membrane receptor for ferrienterochelin and colicin